MSEKPASGEIFGIPYNFERPSIRRLLSAHWQPNEGMVVQKPFGVGYSLNLASWRSWIVLVVAGALLWHETRGSDESAGTDGLDEEPVEVVVD